jgi:hypothetical protein
VAKNANGVVSRGYGAQFSELATMAPISINPIAGSPIKKHMMAL